MQIIIAPHVTEKSMSNVSKRKYTFMVDKNANKLQIASAIKKMYKVNPIAVSICHVTGKNINYRGRHSGKRKDWKKAVVTLREKESIKEFAIKE